MVNFKVNKVTFNHFYTVPITLHYKNFKPNYLNPDLDSEMNNFLGINSNQFFYNHCIAPSGSPNKKKVLYSEPINEEAWKKRVKRACTVGLRSAPIA
jgi:hypothetical protein